jgi:ABC-type lipopolysaccharide export system ATPase subunit
MLSSREVFNELTRKPLIAKMINLKGADLSGGEKRIIEIYLAIYADVKYVLLDEPFNGVSPINIDEIKAAIREQSQFKGFILTDHDYRNIIDISTRIILLHDGGTMQVNKVQDLEKWGYIPESK